MEDLIFSINVVLPIFLIMLLGYFLTKAKFWDAHFTDMANKVSFRLFLPILLFNNIYEMDLDQLFDMKLISFGLGGIIIVILLAVPLVMLMVKQDNKRGVLVQAIFRSNFLIFGIAISGNIFGSEGVGVASKLIGFLIPLFNFCAVIVLACFNKENKRNIGSMIKGVIKNPLIIGCGLGIITLSLGIRLPKPIYTCLHDLGAIGAPLAVLMLGAEFKFEGLRKNIKYIIMGTLGRLVIVPSIALALAIMLGFRRCELITLLAVFGAPVAINSYIMSKEAGADSELAGQLVVVSTFLAPFTLCVFIYFFKIMRFIG